MTTLAVLAQGLDAFKALLAVWAIEEELPARAAAAAAAAARRRHASSALEAVVEVERALGVEDGIAARVAPPGAQLPSDLRSEERIKLI